MKVSVYKMRIRIVLFTIICLLCIPVMTSTSKAALPAENYLNIATIDSRPLFIDRLLYVAFKDIGYHTVFTSTVPRLGFEMANIGEKDGAITVYPNLQESYPELLKVPFTLEETSNNVFVRDAGNLIIRNWNDLSGLKVGILTQRPYISAQIPADAAVTTKENANILLNALAQGEYDVAVLAQRSNETVSLPDGVLYGGTIETLREYLYLNKKHKHLIPEIAISLQNMFNDGRGKQILKNMPLSEMYQKKTIIHIYSSNSEITRQEQFTEELRTRFEDDESVEWYTVTLDSKRFSKDPNRLSAFVSLLRQDCVMRNVAAIVVSGEDALEFLKNCYDLFFQGVPVLFYGIGDDYGGLIKYKEPYITGITEHLAASETVSAAVKLFPGVKNLYVVNDYTAEGKKYRTAIENQLKPLQDSIHIEYNDDVDRETLLDDIKKLPPDSLVFVGSYFRDANRQYYSQSEMTRALEQTCHVPIIALYSTAVPYSSLGGKCLDYEKYGEVIAGMLKRVLDGEKVSAIPVINDASAYSRWVFDKKVMDKYGISEKSLPQDAQVINKSPSMWEADPLSAFSMAGFLALSIVCVIGLFIFSRKLRKKNLELLEMREHLHTAEELLERDQIIRDVKERLERIISASPISYLMSVDGKVVEINENAKKDLGLNLGDDNSQIYTVPADRAKMLERLEQENTVKNMLTSFNLANGESHRCIINSTMLEYNQKQAIVAWAIDIEETEIQKDKMIAAHHGLQIALDAMPIPIRIVDLENGNIVYLNKSCVELFEFESAEEGCTKNIYNTLPEFQSDGTHSSEKVDVMWRTKDPFDLRLEYITAKGKIIDAILTACHIDYKGKKSSVGIIRDLAKEHREMQLEAAAIAAEKALQTKSLFLANMSHEIRTPINAIIGFAELASESAVSPTVKNYLEKIKDGSEVLLSIINDILDISKIEAGKITLENIPFDMHDVFRMCQTIIVPRAKKKGITLYCYTEPSVGKKLLGDPARLRQALLNLLTNAVKFTDTGMVKLLSAIEHTTESSVTMRFEVKDSGIGMTKEQITRIFEPFAQADESTTRRYGGTGLGLPITKNIIEMMGGELAVESALGVGSKFSFVLTFETIDSPSDVSNNEIVVHSQEKPMFKGEVLVCEDNEMNQQVICGHLAGIGLETFVAVNGKEGVEYVRHRMENGEKPFDLIFMDIHMPVMDGLEAAKELGRIGNKSPIVALTANIMTDDRETYRKHGMADYLAKPFQARTLWNFLFKYFTPADLKPVSTAEDPFEDESYQLRLKVHFAKDNQSTYEDIITAIDAGDIKLAHRLAHTLKGVAGLVGKEALREAAGRVELSLKNGVPEVSGEQLDALKNELAAVLNEFSPLLDAVKTNTPLVEVFDKKEIFALLDELETLLLSNDTECIDLVIKLRGVPGTERLVEQTEMFDFKSARESLAEVRRSLG